MSIEYVSMRLHSAGTSAYSFIWQMTQGRSHRDIRDIVWFWEGFKSSVLSVTVQWLLPKSAQYEASSPEVKTWYTTVSFQ